MEKDKVEIIELPKIFDPRGNLTVVEQGKNIPFYIGSTSWIYGVSLDRTIENKTHIGQQKFIVALSGSFNITIGTGENKREFTLSHPYQGLLIPSGILYRTHAFSSGAVCLELSSPSPKPPHCPKTVGP